MSSPIVVTGAAGALGSAVVGHLVAGGSPVAAVDRVEARAALEGLAARLGPACLAVPIDARHPSAWGDALARIEASLGAPAGAALVAGGWSGGAPLHAGDPATFDAMIELNLATVDRALRALLPGLVARGAGSVVVIGSRAAVQPWTSAGAAAYALVQAVAAEVQDHGVRVNAVLPSTIDTPANRAAMPGADASRWVSPASIAGVVAFLLSDAARDVSGAAIPVYGRA
jgi:NAD(P)-dependent dehydrogenase (short-subunit alcohol dehydrogenase family)